MRSLETLETRGAVPIGATIAAIVMGLAVAWAAPATVAAQQCDCVATPTLDCCIGKWTSYGSLGISCTEQTSCGLFDEIGHATLIPTGTLRGHVLIWTGCDAQPFRFPCALYSSHVLDPMTLTIVDHPSFSPALPGDPPSTEGDGHFCSGHTWMLDSNLSPRFLVVGGTNHLNNDKASVQTSWFDPTTNQWVPLGPEDPGDLPDQKIPPNNPPRGSWYPSVITFLDTSLNRFRPIAVGGTDAQGGGVRFQKWWTMSLAGVRTINDDLNSSYYWHYYPRTSFLTSLDVLSAGQDLFDNNDLTSCHKIATQTHTYSLGPDPNAAGPVQGWHMNNAVLMHTLKPGWVWNQADPQSQYDLDRVIGTLGTPMMMPGILAMAYTLELVNGAWVAKANALRARVYSNAVVLPDRSILVVGGQNNLTAGGDALTTYRFVADRFDPQGPTNQGSWTELASTSGTPRGYHSVGILLSDGSVLLMGGQNDGTSTPLPDSKDTVDRFEPPYFFQQGSRPVLKSVPAAIQYGQPFSICVQPLQAQNPWVRFCLIGIGSITHHFDYGQRYVELMFRPHAGSCSQFDVSLQLLAPTAPMAPEGYYLLFGVDSRGVPSLGKFVKLTF